MENKDDKTLSCKDCGKEFTFSKKDQDFYTEKQLSDPKRCKDCRAKKKQRYEQQ